MLETFGFPQQKVTTLENELKRVQIDASTNLEIIREQNTIYTQEIQALEEELMNVKVDLANAKSLLAESEYKSSMAFKKLLSRISTETQTDSARDDEQNEFILKFLGKEQVLLREMQRERVDRVFYSQKYEEIWRKIQRRKSIESTESEKEESNGSDFEQSATLKVSDERENYKEKCPVEKNKETSKGDGIIGQEGRLGNQEESEDNKDKEKSLEKIGIQLELGMKDVSFEISSENSPF